jgi:hypothetical protein
MSAKNKPCTSCGNPVDPLEVFPGDKCLECWKEQDFVMPTAEQLVGLWGGPAPVKVIDFD